MSASNQVPIRLVTHWQCEAEFLRVAHNDMGTPSFSSIVVPVATGMGDSFDYISQDISYQSRLRHSGLFGTAEFRLAF